MVRNIVVRFLLMAAVASVGCGHLIAAEPGAPEQQPPEPISPSARSQANSKLLEQKIAQRDGLQREIDELRRATGTPQQILVKIRAIEINRSKLRRLGVDWTLADGTHMSVSSAAALLKPNAMRRHETFEFDVIGPSDAFHGILRALEEHNVAKMLAEPSIVTLSGRPASIIVGGEFPLPVGPKSNETVQFQKFGTQVDLLATSFGNDDVRMELRVRLIEPDFSQTITVESQSVPTLSVRQCDTAFELPFGQSAVVTGFVQKRTSSVIGIDGKQEQEFEEIETLFIATPEIVTTPETAAPPEVARAYDAPSSVK